MKCFRQQLAKQRRKPKRRRKVTPNIISQSILNSLSRRRVFPEMTKEFKLKRNLVMPIWLLLLFSKLLHNLAQRHKRKLQLILPRI